MRHPKNKIKLNKNLFWDVDISQIDWQRNKEFVVGRILNFGDMQDYLAARRFYGQKRLQNIALKVPWLDKKSLNFWSVIFGIPKSRFLCSKKPLKREHSAFLNY